MLMEGKRKRDTERERERERGKNEMVGRQAQGSVSHHRQFS